MTLPPFDRTVCSCAEDVEPCRRQPGYLIPGDLQRIVRYLGRVGRDDDVERLFWASPGAVVTGGGAGPRSIRTITPSMVDGRCVFLDPEDRCSIHHVAPFGCAYFDAHMSDDRAQRRSSWGLVQIVESEDYRRERAQLPKATSWNPRAYGGETDDET